MASEASESRGVRRVRHRPLTDGGLRPGRRGDRFSLVGPVAITAVFYALVILVLLATHEWDPRFFATVGPQWSRHDPTGRRAADGALFYAIAQDPSRAPELGAKRASRLLYPLLAHAVGLGRPDLVAWALVLVSWAALVAGTAVMGHLLRGSGHTPWCALGYGAWGGLGLALLHGTAEPLAFLLAVTGIAWTERGWSVRAAAAFLAALLTHEVVLVVSLPYLLTVGRRRGGMGRWALPATVLAAWTAWQGFVSWWAQHPVAHFRFVRWAIGLLIPFQGFRFTQLLHVPGTVLQLLIPAVVSAGYAGWRLWRTPREYRLWALLMTALFTLCLPAQSAALLWHSGRLSTGLVVATLTAGPAIEAKGLWRGLVTLQVTTAVWTVAVLLRYLLWDAAPW